MKRIIRENEEKVTELMERMTLEEKIGQLHQIGPSLVDDV